MKQLDISKEVVEVLATLNPGTLGDLYEWALCRKFGVERTKHDSGRYDKGSDLELDNGMNISIKFGGCSLMAGSLCEGETTMDGIWGVFERHTHSNVYAVITSTCQAFLMSLAEFKEFIYMFGRVSRESSKKGGRAKIKCIDESKKRIAWLEARCAA